MGFPIVFRFYGEGSGGSTTEYTNYPITLQEAVNIQMGLSSKPQWWVGGDDPFVDATEAQVEQYLNPLNYCTGDYKYQFLDLSRTAGVNVSDMNQFLSNKGILANNGEAFINAGQQYGISEIYLASHACLETGNGTSELATGVEVNGVTVYNMFGIHAYDSDPEGYGSQYAYDMGWTTPELAIAGGAQWISQQYINNSNYHQNTLYKMRWNPDSSGTHQYATDVRWAVNQTSNFKNLYDTLANADLYFDIPVYS